MLLTISTTHRPATDLGYLLHKHPDRFQSLPLSTCITSVPAPRGGEAIIRRSFEPLGYEVEVTRHTLDE